MTIQWTRKANEAVRNTGLDAMVISPMMRLRVACRTDV